MTEVDVEVEPALPSPLVCPRCATPHPLDERFCPACGMPLVFAGRRRRRARHRRAHERARKIKPQYTEGELVASPTARNQAEAEFIQGLLLEEGVPSMLRRSRGFDVPDMLAAGPRDVLVAALGRRGCARGPAAGRPASAARRRRAPVARAARLLVGLLAVVVARGLIVAWLRHRAASPRRGAAGEARQVRPPRALGVRERAAAEGPLERRARMSPGSRLASAPRRASPSSRASRSSTLPPSSCASRAPGGNAGARALAQAPRDRRPREGGLPAKPLPGAGARATPSARSARACPGRNGGGSAGLSAPAASCA